jgi:hypothetical protein
MAGKIIRSLQAVCLYPGQPRPGRKIFWKATLSKSNFLIDRLILGVNALTDYYGGARRGVAGRGRFVSTWSESRHFTKEFHKNPNLEEVSTLY